MILLYFIFKKLLTNINDDVILITVEQPFNCSVVQKRKE